MQLFTVRYYDLKLHPLFKFLLPFSCINIDMLKGFFLLGYVCANLLMQQFTNTSWLGSTVLKFLKMILLCLLLTKLGKKNRALKIFWRIFLHFSLRCNCNTAIIFCY